MHMNLHAENVINDISRRIDKPLNQAKDLKPAESKMRDKCSSKHDEERLKLDDFINDPYEASEIERDKKEEQRLEKIFDKATPRGKLFEAIVATKSEAVKWFGENTKVVVLSKFDDYINGGDIMLEMQNDKNEIVRIMVDLTTSIQESEATDKIKKTYKLIESGKLSEAKYFKSKVDATKGKINPSARVIIGISPDSLGELCGEFNQTEKQEKNYVQLMFLDEMMNQLINMAETAKAKHGAEHKVTQELEKALKLVKDLLIKKESLRTHEYEQKARRDRTYQQLA